MKKYIKSLAALKRAMVPGAKFQILKHGDRPEQSGEMRQVMSAGKNCMYSFAPKRPETKEANSGKGLWLAWDSAACWEFHGDGVCAKFTRPEHNADTFVLSFRVL